jgi:hypothetical protein
MLFFKIFSEKMKNRENEMRENSWKNLRLEEKNGFRVSFDCKKLQRK